MLRRQNSPSLTSLFFARLPAALIGIFGFIPSPSLAYFVFRRRVRVLNQEDWFAIRGRRWLKLAKLHGDPVFHSMALGNGRNGCFQRHPLPVKSGHLLSQS